ncbi:MAG: hypothetical protein HYR84_02535 [Planctomycetes bacterium]|nr:hypothetical protein [Planctomycetota bacterium]
MVRKLFCSMFVMAIALSVAAAGEFQGRIMKIDGDTITVQKLKGTGKKTENDGDPVKLKLGKDAKIVGGKFDKDAKKLVDGDPITDGLKNELFTKLSDKGLTATITTDGEGDKEMITKIRVFVKKKKAAAD